MRSAAVRDGEAAGVGVADGDVVAAGDETVCPLAAVKLAIAKSDRTTPRRMTIANRLPVDLKELPFRWPIEFASSFKVGVLATHFHLNSQGEKWQPVH